MISTWNSETTSYLFVLKCLPDSRCHSGYQLIYSVINCDILSCRENGGAQRWFKSVPLMSWAGLCTMEMKELRLFFFKGILVPDLKVSHTWWKCQFLINCVIGRKSGRTVAFGASRRQGINFWGKQHSWDLLLWLFPFMVASDFLNFSMTVIWLIRRYPTVALCTWYKYLKWILMSREWAR